MRRILPVFLTLAGCTLSTLSFAQDSFNSCSAAFVGGKLIVDEYSPRGRCRLTTTTTGELTVHTVDLSPTETKALDKIDFKVAIRDKATGTLHLYSDETFRRVPVQRVLARCKKGDHIVLLMIDGRYSLPHNEILVL